MLLKNMSALDSKAITKECNRLTKTVDNSSIKKTSWIPKSIARMFGGGEGYTLSDYIFFAVIILLILLCIWATIGRTVITPFIKDHMMKSGMCMACRS